MRRMIAARADAASSSAYATAGRTLATAESCTGGLIAARITDVAGSSAVLDRGFVTYSNQAKIDMLGVDAAALAEHGAVSETVARQMAEGAVAPGRRRRRRLDHRHRRPRRRLGREARRPRPFRLRRAVEHPPSGVRFGPLDRAGIRAPASVSRWRCCSTPWPISPTP